jgi:hypothetical protein
LGEICFDVVDIHGVYLFRLNLNKYTESLRPCQYVKARRKKNIFIFSR